tara:strand:+ start:73 stop:489 length:417 start_codon:yes stop_codon:yes gene_type:complete
MVSKKNIFDKLSLKKRLELNRQHLISNELTNESNSNSNLLEQLKKLQDGNNKEPLGLKSASFLKSETWYSQKLSEEISLKENKQRFLDQEIREIIKKIANEHQNVKRAKAKASEKRRMEKNELEKKLESMTPKINKLR